ncbi:MAG: hypothetical protein NTW74_13995 [Acidobacteria bacterium]|nr:hypothetical protein [Acidobacteriota bacterium]
MNSDELTLQIVVSAVTGGLAGAIITSIVQRRMQVRLMNATLRHNAINDLKTWTSKAYQLYMANEATWAGANRPHNADGTLKNPEYTTLRNAADLAIKTTFDGNSYTTFEDFAQRLETSLYEAFTKGQILPFEDFHVRREELVQQLLARLWK